MGKPNTFHSHRALLARAAGLCLMATLAACGGGGDESPAGSDARESAANYNPTPLPPLTTSGPVYYFSDCQAGAHVDCVPGDNANAGTSPSAPKRTIDPSFANSLPAGSQVRFARGGAWTNFYLITVNPNATPSQPIVFDSYAPSWGGNTLPWLKSPSQATAFRFGWMSDTLNDGGYVIRNLKLDGDGVADRGFMVHNDVQHLTIDNVEMTGFKIAVESISSSTGTVGVSNFTIRSAYIHDNSSMGFLGDAKDLVIENSVFMANNFSGSAFEHAIYLSGHGERGTIRYNSFVNNSAVNGVCTGGNVTVHGQWDGLVIEGNNIRQDASAGGCYGIAVNTGYTTPEWFRNVKIRRNAIVNVGFIAIGANSAPGIVIEDNLIVNTQATSQTGVVIPERAPGTGDDLDSGAIVRNNTMHFAQPDGGTGVSLRDLHNALLPGNPLVASAGSNLTVVSNLVSYGSTATGTHYCFELSDASSYAAFNNNLCHIPNSTHGRWSWGWAAGTSFSSLVQAQAAGWDLQGVSADPLFVAAPTASSWWTDSLQTGSPAVDAGHASLSSTHDRGGVARSVPNIGSRE